jgi:hypothetical protein
MQKQSTVSFEWRRLLRTGIKQKRGRHNIPYEPRRAALNTQVVQHVMQRLAFVPKHQPQLRRRLGVRVRVSPIGTLAAVAIIAAGHWADQALRSRRGVGGSGLGRWRNCDVNMVDPVGHALDVEVLDEPGTGANVILGFQLPKNSKKRPRLRTNFLPNFF